MKKRKLLAVVAIFLVVALTVGLMTMFAAASDDNPEVVYDHLQRRFEFRNTEPCTLGSEERQYPDLFEDFKGMMPGDSITQTVTVGAVNLSGGYAYISLRTEYDNGDLTDSEREAYQKLISSPYVTLTVVCDGQVLDRGTLEEGVVLGTFHNGDSVEVEITLSIDIRAGNELAGLQAGIGWVFRTDYYDLSDPVYPPVEVDPGTHDAYIIGTDEGLVRPERQITRAEVATIFFRIMSEGSRAQNWSKVNPYYDVYPDDWYNNAISTLTRAGLVTGRPGNVFEPMANITRAELIVMAVRFVGGAGVIEVPEEDAFPDIADSWARDEINLAYALDLVQGTDKGLFEPDREITRAEVMTIINRMLDRKPHKDHLLDNMVQMHSVA